MHLPGFVASIIEPLVGVFRSAGSVFSLSSLGCALVVGAVAIAWRRRRRGRRIDPRSLARMLFPRKLTRSASCAADVFYFLFNVLLFGALFGWVVVSAKWINGQVIDGLTAIFGAPGLSPLPVAIRRTIQTLVLFLAYEFGYWIDHYTSHKFPALWEFHKVHHTAEVLTPFTVWRVHPVEMIKFGNILAIVIAVCNGCATWSLGEPPHPFLIDGKNLLLIVFLHAYIHLQHSNIWIPFTGVWGKIFLSPAHHQIHHSTDPAHFNCNLGSCLWLFDTVFGTVRVPARKPEQLTYGVAGEGAEAHWPSGLLTQPFARVWGMFAPARAVGDSAPARR